MSEKFEASKYLCECGCGQEVKWFKGRHPNRFVVGHAARGKRFTEEHRDRIAEALKVYANRPDSYQKNQPSGSASPRWKDGSSPDSYRVMAFQRFGRLCQRCGSSRHIRVHHKDRDRHNNVLSNLEVLCGSCHAREHHPVGAYPLSEEAKAKISAKALGRVNGPMSAEGIANMKLVASKRKRGSDGRFI